MRVLLSLQNSIKMLLFTSPPPHLHPPLPQSAVPRCIYCACASSVVRINEMIDSDGIEGKQSLANPTEEMTYLSSHLVAANRSSIGTAAPAQQWGHLASEEPHCGVIDNGALSLNERIEGFVSGGVDLGGNFDAEGDESVIKGIRDRNVKIGGEFDDTANGRRFSDGEEGLGVEEGSDQSEASSRC